MAPMHKEFLLNVLSGTCSHQVNPCGDEGHGATHVSTRSWQFSSTGKILNPSALSKIEYNAGNTVQSCLYVCFKCQVPFLTIIYIMSSYKWRLGSCPFTTVRHAGKMLAKDWLLLRQKHSRIYAKGCYENFPHSLGILNTLVLTHLPWWLLNLSKWQYTSLLLVVTHTALCSHMHRIHSLYALI